jgi:16S rRNA (uracil1498-N3)-methyltransferase
MAAPRFYLPPELCTGEVLRLEGREAHHALHVLRVKRGEPVVILDGRGHEFLCEITDASRHAMTLLVKQKNSSRPPSGRITLLQALPRGKIIESIIQKAVELGAHRIVPLLTERVVTHLDESEGTNKREKWRQVAIEAIKQCQTRYGRRPESVAVWIGPEGDFTPDELKLIEASGALPISLGNLTLRVETAAIYCLSILNYELSR